MAQSPDPNDATFPAVEPTQPGGGLFEDDRPKRRQTRKTTPGARANDMTLTLSSSPLFAEDRAPDIKPIETRYAGCRFRSRLEARWAVFLDALNIVWEHEPQGYELPSGQVYLPDFWLPSLDLHAEVKGDEAAFLADGPRYAEAIQTGSLPGRGLLILGPVPDGNRTNPLHFLLKNEQGDDGTVELHADLMSFDSKDADGRPVVFCTDLVSRKPGRLPALSGYGRSGATYTGGAPYMLTSQVASAYTSARSARFEHGESGTTPIPGRKAIKVKANPGSGYLLGTLVRLEETYDLGSVDGRVEALREMAPVLAAVVSDDLRREWIPIAAQRLGLADQLDAVERAVANHRH
ncbi:hypothetical protein MED01_002460 [Micromonospora sp. MED01]|uniref:hypothetical protein n=1 Tax=Micromonospora alfalfae TaxID=2911212 RepID=UPI001EE7FC33|nr:hypothetical protein [Micromonospora alfalfae]MCG5464294.1 hypothetical protein [Micromonospora alfalfae]